MSRKYSVLLILLLMFSPAISVSGEVVLDDFEDGDISKWSMLWGDESSAVQNITLSTFVHSGSYSILLHDGRDGPAIDFAKQDMDVNLENPISYYNISFWYYAIVPCSYPTNQIKHRIYISDESSFLFKAVRVDSGDVMSCGQWQYVSSSIEDDMTEILGSFSLNSTYIGSIMVENWHNSVYYDDIKLIPKIPEDAPEECTPDWSCTDWGDCTDGLQNRVCIDLNGCGDDSTMPSNQRSCRPVISVIEPKVTTFSPGQTMTVTVNVSYPNGTTMSGLDLVINAFNIDISLDEIDLGLYSVMLVPDENDIGTWDVSFSGFENYQFSGLTLEVREITTGNATSFLSDLSSVFSGIISSAGNALYTFWYVIPVLAVLLVSGLIIRRRGMPKIRRPKIRKPKRKKERKKIKKKEERKPKKIKPKKEEIDHDGLHEVKL